MPAHKALVIGSGFAGLSAACHLSSKGFQVTILEKNASPGGRAREFKAEGFTFDMGPSWYWMPDVFEHFFQKFGHKVSDFYSLKRLDPSYRVVFEQHHTVDLPADFDGLKTLFDSYEPGAGARLVKFMDQAAYKYEVGIQDLVYKPSRSILEFVDARLLYGLLRMDVFTSFHSHARRFFKDDKLLRLVEFPVLFLGAVPQNTPALYSLMNYADMKLGTWYPTGGMHQIIKGMVSLAETLGVKIRYQSEVVSFDYKNSSIKGAKLSDGTTVDADVVIASGDYHHIDKNVLAPAFANYSDKYWDKRVMAPSSLIYYLGINKQLPNLIHHNLFFDSDFAVHAKEIYTEPAWPSDPLFYVSCTTKTDPSGAPDGMENVFILIPVAPGLTDTDSIREVYYNRVMDRLEKYCGTDIRGHVVFKRSYAHADFKADYHAFKGNAYGLANTLMQTAILKPSLKSKKLSNLYYAGQLTVPGPGVPPSLISGEVVAGEVAKDFSI
jgi:phytoene desaturase